eukprot:1852674-Prymnesium_polylepis.2
MGADAEVDERLAVASPPRVARALVARVPVDHVAVGADVLRLLLGDPLGELALLGGLVLPQHCGVEDPVLDLVLVLVGARHYHEAREVGLVHVLVAQPRGGGLQHARGDDGGLRLPPVLGEHEAGVAADGGDVHLQHVGEGGPKDEPGDVAQRVVPRLDGVCVRRPVGELALRRADEELGGRVRVVALLEP